MTATPPFLTRVRIKNYKSIKACDVELGSLAFLVGPNGSGKSNFLDALRFVAEALDDSPSPIEPDQNVVHITPGKVPDTPLGRVLEVRGGPPSSPADGAHSDSPSGSGLTSTLGTAGAATTACRLARTKRLR